ncbi:hypothetical protein [Micromonospora radicis]|uniref:Uncharacterized protein n=1 Tax=Micromonospora radicis TaxID=1894971 RepID=A0A418MYI6_9ACTN|nr:hypothetical protein [Micromonospora radicis]RIV39945.1 hypothetical protein D2L64_06280 [Micromonospora radicis]
MIVLLPGIALGPGADTAAGSRAEDDVDRTGHLADGLEVSGQRGEIKGETFHGAALVIGLGRPADPVADRVRASPGRHRLG